MTKQDRSEAALALQVAASNPKCYLFEAVNSVTSESRQDRVRDIAYLARIAAFNFDLTISEVRAEAEALLRTGWNP